MIGQLDISLYLRGCMDYCDKCYTNTPHISQYPTLSNHFVDDVIEQAGQIRNKFNTRVTIFPLDDILACDYWRELLADKEKMSSVYKGPSRDGFSIATNGYTLAHDPKAVQDIKDLGVKLIQLSYDAGIEPFHNQYAGRKNDFEDKNIATQRILDAEMGLRILGFPRFDTYWTFQDFFENYVLNIEGPNTNFCMVGLFTSGRFFGKDSLLPTKKQIEELCECFADIAHKTPNEIKDKYFGDRFITEEDVIKLIVNKDKQFTKINFFPNYLEISIYGKEVYISPWCSIPVHIRSEYPEFKIGSLENKTLLQIIEPYIVGNRKHPITKLYEEHIETLDQTACSLSDTATDRVYSSIYNIVQTWFIWRLVNLIEYGENKVARPRNRSPI